MKCSQEMKLRLRGSGRIPGLDARVHMRKRAKEERIKGERSEVGCSVEVVYAND